jgi:hypothetical protein
MKDRNYNDSHNAALLDSLQHGEYKEGAKYPLSKFDFELFDEEKAAPATVVRVKRTSTNTKGERWRVFRDDELLFVIEGDKISKREREFLRTVDGVSFLTAQVKSNVISWTKIRSELKSKVKKKDAI